MEVERIIDTMVFDTDEEAMAQAIKDGVKIIPAEELPDNFNMKRLGWIDTMDNRNAIAEYADKYCNGRNHGRPLEKKKKTDTEKDEGWIPVEQELPEEGKSVRIKYKNIYGQYCEDVDERLSDGWGSGWDGDIDAWKPMENEDSVFSALAISESYVWQGFGRTEDEAGKSLIKEWNRHFDDNETFDTFEYDIIVHRCIPGTGFSEKHYRC